ncbi:MAG: hypothetical protein GX049_11525 [Alcaligenaceae bacterium]|nr:hypothetical protein [Alcaligenaceae bacterium]
MIKKLIFLAALVCPLTVAAKKPSPELLAKLAVTYVDQIGCELFPLEPDSFPNFTNFTKFVDKKLGIEEGYIVLVTADITCSGGSAMDAELLILLDHPEGRSVLDESDYRYLRVNPLASEPVAYSNGPSHITSVYQKYGQLYARALTHSGNDATCCPSVKHLYKVDLKMQYVKVNNHDRPFYAWEFTEIEQSAWASSRLARDLFRLMLGLY